MAISLTLLGGLNAVATPLATTTYGGDTFSLYAAPGISWSAAEDAANVDGGYLAILPDQATIEAVYNGLIGNGFFTANAGQQFEAYLGAVPADGSYSTSDANNWSWVTSVPPSGPVASVVPWTVGDNFHSGEPNGDSEGLAINRYGTYEFNDEGGYVGGYIVETQGVPDFGSTQVMLLGACAMIGAVGRRLRR